MKNSLFRLILTLGAAFQVSGTHAAEVIIDDFTTVQSATGTVDGAGILGGERDASISGGNLLNISGGSAVMSLPSDQTGNFIILSWDGNDGTTTVGYELGDIDITDSGNNDTVYLNVTAVSGSVSGRVGIDESGSAFSQFDFEIDHTGLYALPLESFATSNPPPDFTTVNRIILRIIMNPGESVTINQFRIPSSLLFEDGFENSP